MVKKVLFSLMIILLLASASAVTWKKAGTPTMTLDDDGNLIIEGNITIKENLFLTKKIIPTLLKVGLNTTHLEDVNAPSPANGQYLRYNSSSQKYEPVTPENLSASIFYAYRSSGGIVITTTWTNITWTDEVRKDTEYTHAANSEEITINEDGWYKITFDCSADVSDTTRSHTDWRIIVNGAEAAGTRSAGYHRDSADGKDSTSLTTLISFTAGDVLVAQGLSDRATQITTVPNSCRILIEKPLTTVGLTTLIGPQGPKGLDGTSGGGWANDSVKTSTSFNVEIPSGNLSVGGEFQSRCGYANVFFAEENAVLGDNTYEWAFGNGGAVQRGLTMACDGSVTAVSLSCNTAGTATDVNIQVNGVDSACNIVLTGQNGYTYCDASFNAGDYLVPHTTTAGGCSNAIVTFWVRYD